MQLFTKESGCELYNALRDGRSEHSAAARERCTNMWEIYQRHADDQFVIEFAKQTHARYWEMYLAMSLIDIGYDIECPKPGPDVGITFEGVKIWFEATCPGPGELGSFDYIGEPALGKAYTVPNEKIILRYLNSISTKMQQHQQWVNTGVVAKDDVFIIAINPKMIPFEHGDTAPPRILQTCYPVGNPYLTINRDTGDVIGSGYEFRKSVPKGQDQSQIPTGAFEDFAALGGVLCSRNDAQNWSPRLGGDFQLALNPWASRPAPAAFKLRGTRFTARIEDEKVSIDSESSNDITSTQQTEER